jgi:hypothetical protein
MEIPVTICVDNTGRVPFSNNWSSEPFAKHTALRFHSVRESIENSVITISFVRSGENVSDIFTKGLHQNGSGVGNVCSEKESVKR